MIYIYIHIHHLICNIHGIIYLQYILYYKLLYRYLNKRYLYAHSLVDIVFKCYSQLLADAHCFDLKGLFSKPCRLSPECLDTKVQLCVRWAPT